MARAGAELLNSGGCMSYATAKLSDQPLLCAGEDFSRTDPFQAGTTIPGRHPGSILYENPGGG